jgi:HK97 family phage prohead protease
MKIQFKEVESLLQQSKKRLPTPEHLRLHKSSTFINVKLKGEKYPDDAFVGIFSVLGNRDSYGDRICKGAFVKTMTEGRRRVRHLWNHIGYDPPVAEILDLFEIGKSDLPEEVLQRAPDAKGGAVVVRRYLSFPRAQEIREGVERGAINEMSFAFDIPRDKYQYGEEVVDNEPVVTRWLQEVILYDTSDVNWGANDATVASFRALPTDFLASELKTFIDEVEAGVRNSPLDQALFRDLQRLVDAPEEVSHTPGITPPDTSPEVAPADQFRRARDLRTRVDFFAQGSEPTSSL